MTTRNTRQSFTGKGLYRAIILLALMAAAGYVFRQMLTFIGRLVLRGTYWFASP